MKWMGPPTAPGPRRLWAVFVGVSKAMEGSNLDLRFPENDAIDLARLFINDFERRTLGRAGEVQPDFARIHVDLAVSAFPAAEQELVTLSRHGYVVRRGATKADVAAALQKVPRYCRSQQHRTRC